jgi:hypothetical protein
MNSPIFNTLEQAIINTNILCPGWPIEEIKTKINELNLNTIELIKDYCERITQYEIFVKDLLKRLTEENIIKLSKQKYYSLTNNNTKGCNGEYIAYKYIFNNYIVETFEYNALPENKKNGWKTINDKYLMHHLIRVIIKQIEIIEEDFKNKYNIAFDEI